MSPASVLYLLLAIVSEVVATSSLKASDGFRNPIPSLVVVVGYACSFYLLGLTLRTIPIGVAYAIWSGLGTALLTLVGVVVYKQSLSPLTIVGILLVVAGVAAINVGSGSATH